MYIYYLVIIYYLVRDVNHVSIIDHRGVNTDNIIYNKLIIVIIRGCEYLIP